MRPLASTRRSETARTPRAPDRPLVAPRAWRVAFKRCVHGKSACETKENWQAECRAAAASLLSTRPPKGRRAMHEFRNPRLLRLRAIGLADGLWCKLRVTLKSPKPRHPPPLRETSVPLPPPNLDRLHQYPGEIPYHNPCATSFDLSQICF